MSRSSRTPSIRLRRYPSANVIPTTTGAPGEFNSDDATPSTRRRSGSAPEHVTGQIASVYLDDLSRQRTAPEHMMTIAEGHSVDSPPSSLYQPPTSATRVPTRRRNHSIRRELIPEGQCGTQLVDLLDVIDPEVSTLTTLNNVQNSLFVPDLGRWLNRTPTYNLSRDTSEAIPRSDIRRDGASSRLSQSSKVLEGTTPQSPEDLQQLAADRLGRRDSITSDINEDNYAVLPHGMSLEGWSEEEKEVLNDHVRHLLHSRRAKFKRTMKGFGQYVRTPLGFFITLYAFLITVFGLIWVLFLIGWISGGGQRSYDINVVDNVLVALFAIIGDGLAPFRAVDTYHMIFIAHYARKTWHIRQKTELPALQDPNDLPRSDTIIGRDAELGKLPRFEDSVLTDKQQASLEHHQKKFSRSHTYYKPHETDTHYAFPVALLIAITVLLDLHSCFQIALGTCTWAISYHVRPAALTPVILVCSITCNITGGVLITIGDRRTRKQEVIERMTRQKLTEEALEKMQKSADEKGHGDY